MVLLVFPVPGLAESKLSFTEDEVTLMLEMETSLEEYRAEYERLKDIGYGGQTLRADLGTLGAKVAKLSEILEGLGSERSDLTVAAGAIVNNVIELKHIKKTHPGEPFTALFVVEGLTPDTMDDFRYSLLVVDTTNHKIIEILTSGMHWQHSDSKGSTALLMPFPMGLSAPGGYRFELKQRDAENTLEALASVDLKVIGEKPEEAGQAMVASFPPVREPQPGTAPQPDTKNESSIPTQPPGNCNDGPCGNPGNHLAHEVSAYIREQEGDDALRELTCKDLAYLQERQNIYIELLPEGISINNHFDPLYFGDDGPVSAEKEQLWQQWTDALDRWHAELQGRVDRHWDEAYECFPERSAVAVDSFFRNLVAGVMNRNGNGGQKDTAGGKQKISKEQVQQIMEHARLTKELDAQMVTTHQEWELVTRNLADYKMAFSVYQSRLEANGKLSASDRAKAENILAAHNKLVERQHALVDKLDRIKSQLNAAISIQEQLKPALKTNDGEAVARILGQ